VDNGLLVERAVKNVALAVTPAAEVLKGFTLPSGHPRFSSFWQTGWLICWPGWKRV